MAILYVGIDLAKNVFAIHGVDEHGKAVLVRPSVQRARLHQLVAALPPCTVAMEACSGAHHWARLFAQQQAEQTRLPHRQTGGGSGRAECGPVEPDSRSETDSVPDCLRAVFGCPAGAVPRPVHNSERLRD